MHLRKLILVILLSGLVTAGFAAQQRMVDAEIVIARSVADREPVGAGEEFPSNVGQRPNWIALIAPCAGAGADITRACPLIRPVTSTLNR